MNCYKKTGCGNTAGGWKKNSDVTYVNVAGHHKWCLLIWVPKKCLNLGVQNNHSSFLFLKTLELIQTFVKETYIHQPLTDKLFVKCVMNKTFFYIRI